MSFNVSSPLSKKIAKVMCSVTEEMLWLPENILNREKQSGLSFRTREGSGYATYYCNDTLKKQHVITYGRKMIVDQFDSGRFQLWATSDEISKRKYFEGKRSPVNLLAHVICHEYSHFLQALTGNIVKGSIHNKMFYSYLDKMHQYETGLLLREVLLARLLALDVGECNLTEELVALSCNWSVGMEAAFYHQKNDEYIKGVIVQINRKTIMLNTGKYIKHNYKVPKALLAML